MNPKSTPYKMMQAARETVALTLWYRRQIGGLSCSGEGLKSPS